MENCWMHNWNTSNGTTEYKGYYIEYDLYRLKEYTVQYCGDDVMFEDMESAKLFIDSIQEKS